MRGLFEVVVREWSRDGAGWVPGHAPPPAATWEPLQPPHPPEHGGAHRLARLPLNGGGRPPERHPEFTRAPPSPTPRRSSCPSPHVEKSQQTSQPSLLYQRPVRSWSS